MTPGNDAKRMAGWLENAWLARYLDRELSDDEAAWFEAYALDKADLLEMIEADTNLRDALAKNAETGEVPMRQVSRSAPQVRTRERHGRIRAGFGIAAGLLVAIGAGWFGRDFIESGVDKVPFGDPARLTFRSMRGDSADSRTEAGNSHGRYLVVQIALPLDARNPTLDLGDGHPTVLGKARDGTVYFVIDRRLSHPRLASISYESGGETIRERFDITTVND